MAESTRKYSIELGLGGLNRVVGGLGLLGSAVTRLIGPLALLTAGGAVARGVQTAIRLADESAKSA